jgi:hypothetical protein
MREHGCYMYAPVPKNQIEGGWMDGDGCIDDIGELSVADIRKWIGVDVNDKISVPKYMSRIALCFTQGQVCRHFLFTFIYFQFYSLSYI